MTALRFLSALASLLVALAAGIWLGGHPETLPSPVRRALVADDRALRAEIIDTILDHYYRPISRARLERGSLDGIVNTLRDPYSHYFSPDEARRLRESVEGRFQGVGMSVFRTRRGLRVMRVFPRSPAARGGIRAGDLIVAVDGRSIAGLSAEQATALIKGPAGTRVRLTVERADGRRRTLSLVRREIKVPLVESQLDRVRAIPVGVVRLAGFSDGAHGQVARAVKNLQKRGARAFVLDLRGNGGGLLSEAVLVSSVFLRGGEVVAVKGRGEPTQVRRATGDPVAPTAPLVVLVDRASASASEIVAGALRARRRAELVGTRTFGKGVVQELFQLSNGGVLDITVAFYELPDGRRIGRGGLRPDVAARDDPRTRADEALRRALAVAAARASR
ncbi:S41 family peptidase [Thermoleophilum album]|uniref:Carboxyl-terminal processing protease n=1 Tax=Thermoleophilum album TaxID=29539 RepID=A0A1H6FHA2_THEAL|nr:S41 family peptidase [Thermoleophilum album]SEH10229.1 carboxyl-terminal processing protease [Thermoleophilum album]